MKYIQTVFVIKWSAWVHSWTLKVENWVFLNFSLFIPTKKCFSEINFIKMKYYPLNCCFRISQKGLILGHRWYFIMAIKKEVVISNIYFSHSLNCQTWQRFCDRLYHDFSFWLFWQKHYSYISKKPKNNFLSMKIHISAELHFQFFFVI